MKKNRHFHLTKSQQGFTLLESLLALFILTIGLLGVAGMHMQGMNSSNISIQRMTATIKVQDILERIRANSTATGVAIDAYQATLPADGGCNRGTDCTAAEMVAHDLFMWTTDLNAALPGTPVTTIEVVPPLVTVKVEWVDRGEGHSYTAATRI